MNINNRKNIQQKLAELELLEDIEFSFKNMGEYDCIKINNVDLREIREHLCCSIRKEKSNRLVDVLKNEISKMKAEIKIELEKL